MTPRFSDVWGDEPLSLVKTQTNAVALNTTGDVTLLNLSGERGFLTALGFKATANITGNPIMTFTITIDGGTPLVLTWFNALVTVDSDFAALATTILNISTAAGVAAISFQNLPFSDSCLIVLNRATAASAGSGNFTTIHKVPVA